MNCLQAERHLAGYLDGAISPRYHAQVREHLAACQDCNAQLERFRRLAVCLASVAPAAPPPDLAVRIRVRAAQSGAPWSDLRRLWSRTAVSFENILKPLAVPATGGILTALFAFVFLVQNILVGVPMTGIVPNDLPLNLVQPARLESLAPFPVPGVIGSSPQSESGELLLEATLNAAGEVVSYKILSGPNDPAVQRQLDQVMLFSRFSPQLSFGRPQAGGRVLVSFSEVRVRG
ncbi:MAG: zf-HC2 domain-containing protein [Candidatus Acidiferrales bacterium]